MNSHDEYVPYGDQWKAEMNKLPKAVLIEMLANTFKREAALSVNVLEMRKAQKEYFLTRDRKALALSKGLESEVDKLLDPEQEQLRLI